VTAATTNRRLLIAAAAVGVVAGLAGIGASIAGTSDAGGAPDAEPPPTSTTATAPAADEDPGPTDPAAGPPGAEEGAPAEESPAAEEAPAGEAAAEEELTEEQEAALEARLEAEAAVSRAEAEQIARGQAAGPVERSRISDETGTSVWEVRIDGDGGHTDVSVDATTGQVLAVDD